MPDLGFAVRISLGGSGVRCREDGWLMGQDHQMGPRDYLVMAVVVLVIAAAALIVGGVAHA